LVRDTIPLPGYPKLATDPPAPGTYTCEVLDDDGEQQVIPLAGFRATTHEPEYRDTAAIYTRTDHSRYTESYTHIITMGEEVDSSEGIHVVIVGAGLAGLSAALSTKLANPAHRVTVLETVKELQEVGVSGGLFSYPFSAFPIQEYLSPLTSLSPHLLLSQDYPHETPS
jgi:hypothetical protein